MALIRKHILKSITVVLIAALCFFMYKAYFAWQFSKSYHTYATLSEAHVTAAFLPATNDNQLRQELNRMLSDVLAAELSRTDRVVRAERGIVLLKELEKQIDGIGEGGEIVSRAIADLEARASGGDRREIVNLALERMRVIGDIRGLSYRANYHTAEIFNRVLEDGGALTAEHVQNLNQQLPLVEEQFDRRTNLYKDLERVTSSINATYRDLSFW